MMRRICLTALCACLASVLGASPRVSLLTALPGEEVYALEGHTAIRVLDPEAGEDYVVNWGVYDFNAPNFLGRFVAGQTDYVCAAQPTGLFINSYLAEGRRVVEQVLSLDSMQTASLIGLMQTNLHPRNRTYRYNYVKDNCATRPLLLIEAAIGRKLLSDAPASTTFRKEMRRFHRDYPWYQFGIDLALGRGIDNPISIRETAFSPVTLMELMDRSGAVSRTLTYGEQTLRHEPTPRILTPMALALLIFLGAVAVTWFRKGARTYDTLLFGAYFLTGSLLFYLDFFSEHEATSPNILILWLNPLCLLGALLPWIKKAKKAEMSYFFVNFALLLLLALLAPLLGRGMNPAFWPLIAADALRSIANYLTCKKALNRT